MHAKSCKSHCDGGVKVALGGRLAALCQGEVHAKSCNSHCNGGVKVALGGRFGAVLGESACQELQIALLWVVGLRRCARGKCGQHASTGGVYVWHVVDSARDGVGGWHRNPPSLAEAPPGYRRAP